MIFVSAVGLAAGMFCFASNNYLQNFQFPSPTLTFAPKLNTQILLNK